MMDEDEIVDLLLGRQTARMEEAKQEGVLPAYLVPKYFREGAARAAAELPELSPRLTAALLRAAFGDEEEDVRAAARHALILQDSDVGDIVHRAVLLDDDPDVRDSALDEALAVRNDSRRTELVRRAIHALAEDDCEVVRTRALEFARTYVDPKQVCDPDGESGGPGECPNNS